MKSGPLAGPRQFLEQALRKIPRNTLEWYMVRLYYDLTTRSFNGENDLLSRLENEQNNALKGQMAFYLAYYYDIRDMNNLAEKYFLMSRDIGRKGTQEWRLNQWVLEARNLVLL
jgi:hypothetical protein